MTSLMSKIKIGEVVYNLKDAQSRQDLTALLGGHAVSALGAAAWEGVASEVNEDAQGLATAAAVKNYVDAQVGAINSFDVRIYEALPTASADTMYILGMVQDNNAEAGTYVEYITVRSGADGAYAYAWEKIGSTKTDLTDYLTKTATVAGVAFGDDKAITADEMKNALGLGEMAYVDTASGSTTLATVDSIEMNEMTVAGNATVTHTSANASLTKGDYTPAGSILVDGKAQTGEGGVKAIKGGSIEVTLKDAANATDAVIAATSTFVPTGTVSAKEGGSFSALKSATFQADDDGVQIGGSNAASAVTFVGGTTANVIGSVKDAAVLPSFTDGKIGTFVAPSLGENFVTAGTAATYEHVGFSGGSLGDATKSAFASAGLVATMDEEDAETLVFSAAPTANAVTAQGAFTPAVYGTDNFNGGSATVVDVTKFNAGSWTAGTFNAGSAATFNKVDVVDNIGTGTAAGQTFTGNKYKVAVESDTALKDVAFVATNDVAVPTQITYVKQAVDTKVFNPEVATISFSGSTAENVLVTGVSYDKANATAAFSEAVTPTVKNIVKTNKAVEITVSPDVEG